MAEFASVIQTITNSSAVVRLSGDMDAHSCEYLEDEFGKMLEGGVLGLVLDLSDFASATSAGLGAIVNLSHILEDRGGKLFVTAPRPDIRGLMEMLGLDESLAIVESPDQAKKMAASVRPS